MSQIGSSAALVESTGRSTVLSPNTATTVLTTSSGVARSAESASAETLSAFGAATGLATGLATGADAAAIGVGTVTGATDPARPQAPTASNHRIGTEWEGSFTRGN